MRKMLFTLLALSGIYLAVTQRAQIARGYETGKGYIMQKAAELIKSFEGFSLSPYKDSAGKWTIGWGHLMRPHEPIAPITLQRAEELLAQDMKNAQNAVTSYIKVPVTESQRAALVSLAFNIGVYAFRDSTLVKKINARDFIGAAEEFKRWNKITINGQKIVSVGLSNRRAQEKAIFEGVA